MILQELKDALQEIRDGRSEDGTLDWKRKFWMLNQKHSLKEFLKDITAMANSTAPDNIRRILLGVASGGVLYDSPLPDDEAKVQQHLTAITPIPNVHFESFILEGKTITVAEIRPPFDRPYVAKVDNEYHVWVRLGSRTATASRQLLDRFYQARERTPDIEVSWRIWTSRKRTEDPRGRHTDGLVIPPPKFFLDELRQTLEEESQLAQARASQATDPEYVERLNAYQQRYESFLEKIAHSHLLGRWYYWKEIERAWNPAPHPELMRYFSVVVTNNGNAPATGVSVQVKFPPWLFIFSDQPKMPDFFRPNPPSLDPPPPSPPRRPRDSQLPSWIGGPLPSIGGTRSQAPQSIRVQLFEEKNRLSLEADSLTHTYHFGESPRFTVLALPNMPRHLEHVEIEVSLFWKEIENSQHKKLSIKVEGGQDTATRNR